MMLAATVIERRTVTFESVVTSISLASWKKTRSPNICRTTIEPLSVLLVARS